MALNLNSEHTLYNKYLVNLITEAAFINKT